MALTPEQRQFILDLLKEGREWLALLAFFLGWHMRQPPWMKKRDGGGSAPGGE